MELDGSDILTGFRPCLRMDLGTILKYSFSGLALMLCVLLTATVVAGCGGGQPTERPAPTSDDGQPTQTFAAISSGYFHTCGLREDGSAVCWGDDELGQARPPEGETLAAVSSGWAHTCGLREDGSAVCWGGARNGAASPPEGETFAAVSSGGYHTCGLRKDDVAVCWGNDEFGQASPPEGEIFAAVSSGGAHTCGLREDGAVVCWGRDSVWDEGQASQP